MYTLYIYIYIYAVGTSTTTHKQTKHNQTHNDIITHHYTAVTYLTTKQQTKPNKQNQSQDMCSGDLIESFHPRLEDLSY